MRKLLDSPCVPASLNGIPPELLSQIFQTYLDILSPRNSRVGLLNLCLTCRRWKEIIYSTAEFWAYVGIRVRANSDASLINEIQTWLKRSRRHPLKISLIVEGYSRLLHSIYTRLVEPILALLCEEIHRWSNMSFSFGLYSIVNLPTKRTVAPILESLELNMAGYHPLNCKWLALLLLRSPNLRTFIGDIPPREQPSVEILPIPFSQLSTIDISSVLSFRTALGIINSMPSLKVCRISLEEDSDEEVETTRPSLATCYAYELKLGVRGYCGSFLASLLTPNLERLELHLLQKIVPMSQENPFHDFLRKTSSTLTSFTIRNLYMTDNDLLTCLQILSPRLKSLRILSDKLWPLEYYDVENFTDLVISAMNYDIKQPPTDILCPALEVLTLHRCVLSEDGLLSQMIKSRWNVYQYQVQVAAEGNQRPCGLYFFEAVLRYHANLEDCRVLEELRRQGLGGQTRHGIPNGSFGNCRVGIY